MNQAPQPDQSNPNPMMAHIQAMQEQHGHYSLAEHGLPPELDPSARADVQQGIGTIGVAGAFHDNHNPVGEAKVSAPVKTTAETLNDMNNIRGLNAYELDSSNPQIKFAPISMVSAGDVMRDAIEDTIQLPVAVIRAAADPTATEPEDDYAIFHVTRVGAEKSAFLVAKLGDTIVDQPMYVGKVTEEGMVIGRGNEYGNAISENTSRKHATVKIDEYGYLTVENHGQNGTTVVIPSEGFSDRDLRETTRNGIKGAVKREDSLRNPLVVAPLATPSTQSMRRLI